MAGDRTPSQSRVLANFARDQRGVTAVLVALTLVALIGFTGLGVDAGWWYTIKRQNQSAADAAALSAAYEIVAGNTNVANRSYACGDPSGDAKPLGKYRNRPIGDLSLQRRSSSPTASKSSCTSSRTAGSRRCSSLANVDIANRAVARVSTRPPGCMLALNPTANDAINLAGNPTINAPDCTLVSDFQQRERVPSAGQLDHQRGRGGHPRRLVAHWRCLYPDIEKSRADRAANSRSRPVTTEHADAHLSDDGAASHADHGHLQEDRHHPGPGVVLIAGSSIGTGQTLSANTQISGGLSIKNGTVNLSPGTYWITDGDLQPSERQRRHPTLVTGCTSGGAGVTIILTTANTASGGTVGTLTYGLSNATITPDMRRSTRKLRRLRADHAGL